MIIKFNDKQYKVVNHWFWDEFSTGIWERQTYNVFERYIDKDTTYVDIGAWLGATLIYASQFTDKLMYAVEANPLSYEMLCENVKSLDVALSNICITDKDNQTVGFGGKNNLHNTSSASNINGDCWQIQSRTLLSYLKENNLVDCGDLFIKIDIEGAEELILRDLAVLKDKKNITVYLSLHSPFMRDKVKFSDKFLELCCGFQHILDSNMKELPIAKLAEMILTDKEKPEWGTKFGNFFEVVLSNKDV